MVTTKPPRPGKKCIFGCDAKATKEHIFPSWIRERFPSTSSHHHRYYEGANVSADHGFKRRIDDFKRRTGRHLTLNILSACRDCNSGWMGKLQDDLRPTLLPLVLGELHFLNEEEQRRLASWIVMKTMVGEFGQPKHVVTPQAHREAFKATLEPPPNWEIHIAGYSGQPGESGLLNLTAQITLEGAGNDAQTSTPMLVMHKALCFFAADLLLSRLVRPFRNSVSISTIPSS